MFLCVSKKKSMLKIKFQVFSLLFPLVLFFSCGEPQKEILREFDYYHFHKASKSIACWKLEAERTEENKIALYANILRDINSKSASRVLLETVETESAAAAIKEAFRKTIFRGDRCVIVFPGKGYHAYDIYTGEVIETSKNIAVKFPQLADGISKTDYYGDSKDILALNDVRGKLYYFDMNQFLLYETAHQKFTDSLVRNENCGLDYIKDSTGITFSIIDGKGSVFLKNIKYKGKIISSPPFCLITLPSKDGMQLVNYSGPDYSMLIGQTRFGKLLAGLKDPEEDYKNVDFRINNGVLCAYSNGKDKFGAGYELGSGKEIFYCKSDTLFEKTNLSGEENE
jgi:hypothetical protein